VTEPLTAQIKDLTVIAPCEFQPGDRVARREHEWGTVTAAGTGVAGVAGVAWDGNEEHIEIVPLAELRRITPDVGNPAEQENGSRP
jgi:hypothetical protein